MAETSNKKTIGFSALALLLGGLVVFAGFQIGDDNVYYCEDRQLVWQCDSLSQYVLPNGKCWNEKLGNKICKTGDGWIEVTDDFVVDETGTETLSEPAPAPEPVPTTTVINQPVIEKETVVETVISEKQLDEASLPDSGSNNKLVDSPPEPLGSAPSGYTERLNSNGKEWACQGKEAYSRCVHKGLEGWYGELV